MKKLTILISILFLASCEVSSTRTGPEGPPGPPGVDGLIGQGFEVVADFNESNDYGQIFTFPDEVEVLDTDIVVVYWLFEVNQETNNDVWQQLPASIFFEDGQFQYAFDHTLADVQLFLQGSIGLNTLGPRYTQEQIFRVAILPVNYVTSNNIDLSNMEQVMGAVGKNNFERVEL